ncbi:MAG: hypothetical protein KatS3mg036_0337 [Ignavibacterium sp.]|nr:MAG: hypothetical protein KatS3mg036_0337 [Ignavibacterium sp.]
MRLVDDNDDNDRWEDGFYHYNVLTTDSRGKNRDVLNRVGDFFLLGYRQNTNELVSLSDNSKTARHRNLSWERPRSRWNSR